MLALTHHFVVQYAAYLVRGKEEWFTDYAVLGDDVVIANGPIAHKYLYIMNNLGVKVGIHKSLLSPQGESLEFAKRYFFKRSDCSAIPLREVYAGTISVSASIELLRKYRVSIAGILAFNHFGFRSLSHITSPFAKMSSRMRALILSSLIPRTLTAPALTAFLSFRSLYSKLEIEPTVLQSVSDSFISLMDAQLAKLDKTSSLLKYLVAVDRTRAHYGTVKFEQDPRIIQLIKIVIDKYVDFSKLPVPNELYSCLVTINEFIYRDQYMNTLLSLRDIRNNLDVVRTSPKEESVNSLLISLVKLESEMNLLSFVEKDQRRVISEMKSSVSRYLRMWKSVNLGMKFK
jgi:hypothetical protein